jgi:hypothetical protein
MVLDHKPSGRCVDHFSPGALRRQLRKTAGMPGNLVKRHPGILGARGLLGRHYESQGKEKEPHAP